MKKLTGIMFPKQAKKKRKKHRPSILHRKDGTCFLCACLRGDFSKKQLEEHHIFYGPNRSISEEEGLKVYLCHSHHQYAYASDPEAVHANPKSKTSDLFLKRIAQEAYEKTHSREDFIRLIGRNYLEEEK